MRGALLASARGRALEIGVGTGLSLVHYPEVEELVGVDPSEPMLRRARRRATDTVATAPSWEAPADALPLENSSFDTVVTPSPCSAPSTIDSALSPRYTESFTARWEAACRPDLHRVRFARKSSGR